MSIVSISDAKASLSALVKRVLEGDEIIISRAGKPVAKLVPYEPEKTPRDLSKGIWAGRVWVAEDFDELPEDLRSAFGGQAPDEAAS